MFSRGMICYFNAFVFCLIISLPLRKYPKFLNAVKVYSISSRHSNVSVLTNLIQFISYRLIHTVSTHKSNEKRCNRCAGTVSRSNLQIGKIRYVEKIRAMHKNDVIG